MKPKTPAQRQSTRRDKMRKAGFVLCQYWLRPKDQERVRQYVDRLK
ncbi:MAG: hypothetical protein V3U02_09220 [Calditrichia bacterium]